MDDLIFRVLSATLILIFTLGVATILLRRMPIWVLVGQAISWKAIAFSSAVFATYFPEKAAVLSTLFFVALFFLLVLTAVGGAILIREQRFGRGEP